MIVFIPAWQEQESVEFDDTVNHVRIFVGNDAAVEMMTRLYLPDKHYFLHRLDLLECQMWNAFDELQNAQDNTVADKVLTIHDFFQEDEPYEFIYTPSHQLVYLNDKLRGEVKYGVEGCLKEIIYYATSGVIDYGDTFDDRGFLSSRVLYQEGIKSKTIYFSASGDEVLEDDYLCHVVRVLGRNSQLSRRVYPDMNQVLTELEESHLKLMDEKPNIVVSMHESSSEEVQKWAKFGRTVGVSLFGKEVNFENEGFVGALGDCCDYVVVDSSAKKEQLVVKLKDQTPIYEIPPYDTRLRLGTSSEQKKSLVYLDVRDVDKNLLKQYFKFLSDYRHKHEDTIYYLRTNDIYQEQLIREMLIEEIQKEFPGLAVVLIDEMVTDGLETQKIENKLYAEALSKSDIEQIRNLLTSFEYGILETEIEMLPKITSARVVVDIRQDADLFTQIAALSSAVPQINVQKTQYIVNGENGLVISGLDKLEAGLDYFLEDLMNWNQAVAYSVQQIKKYSKVRLFNQWESILKL